MAFLKRQFLALMGVIGLSLAYSSNSNSAEMFKLFNVPGTLERMVQETSIEKGQATEIQIERYFADGSIIKENFHTNGSTGSDGMPNFGYTWKKGDKSISESWNYGCNDNVCGYYVDVRVMFKREKDTVEEQYRGNKLPRRKNDFSYEQLALSSRATISPSNDGKVEVTKIDLDLDGRTDQTIRKTTLPNGDVEIESFDHRNPPVTGKYLLEPVPDSWLSKEAHSTLKDGTKVIKKYNPGTNKIGYIRTEKTDGNVTIIRDVGTAVISYKIPGEGWKKKVLESYDTQMRITKHPDGITTTHEYGNNGEYDPSRTLIKRRIEVKFYK